MKKNAIKKSLKLKLIIIIISILLIQSLIFAFLIIRQSDYTYRKSLFDKGVSFAVYIADISQEPLLKRDYLQLDTIVKYINNDPDVAYAFILDDKNIPLTSIFSSLNLRMPDVQRSYAAISKTSGFKATIEAVDKNCRNMQISVPIAIKDEIIGKVVVGMCEEKINALMRKEIILVIFTKILSFFVVLFLAMKLLGLITGPIIALSELMLKVSKDKDYSLRARVKDEDEVGVLAKGFNAMLGEIQKHQEQEKAQRKELEQEIAQSTEELRQTNKMLVEELGERKRLETTLEKIAQEWRATFDSIRDAVCLLDSKRKIVRCNTQMRNLIGRPFQEIVGRDCYEIVIPDASFHQLACPFERAQKTQARESIVFLEGKNWFMATVDPLIDKEGNFTGAVFILSDITERKEVETQQRLTQLGKLAAEIAHEVNNPLMAISGRAQLSLMEDFQNETLKNNLNIIMKECQRAKNFIGRVLEFSKPGARTTTTVNINASIEEMVQLIEHQFLTRGIEIKKRYGNNLPQITVDEKAIQEVIMNLLTNARDAITGNGVIEITTSLDKDKLRIEMQDSGLGMSKEVLEKISDPFFTTKKQGTGLGLGICHNILRTHDGELVFESEPGKGTTAIITLPLKK